MLFCVSICRIPLGSRQISPDVKTRSSQTPWSKFSINPTNTFETLMKEAEGFQRIALSLNAYWDIMANIDRESSILPG